MLSAILGVWTTSTNKKMMEQQEKPLPHGANV